MGSIGEDTTDDSTDLAPTQTWPGQLIVPITPDGVNAINLGLKVIDVWVLLKYRDTFERCQYDETRLRSVGKISSRGELALIGVYSNVSNPATLDDDGCAADNGKGSKKAKFP